jgi:hypothetical protein
MDEGEKLLVRARSTKAGWGERDLRRLYEAFGFVYREGRDRFYSHPRYPQLFGNVPRHTSVSKGAVAAAVRLIGQLKEIQRKETNEHDE